MSFASDKDVVEKFSVNPPNVYGFGHQAYYQHVIDCLVNQRAALVDGLEGRKSLELISALYELIETGQEVSLHFVPRLMPARCGVVSQPDVHHVGVRDVEFGARVKIVEPCNLYGCKIGDDCFVGPFTEIQKGAADRGADAGAVACIHLRTGDDRRGLFCRPWRDVHQ